MALRCTQLKRIFKNGNSIHFSKFKATASAFSENKILPNKTTLKTEENLIYLEDPDSFGTLTKNLKHQAHILKDEGDKKEREYLENGPLPSQKLTISQYANIIKQYLSHKRLKEAIDVLEVRMLNIDRVKPENYIYNILIGACADVGYTKKAFKLFNDMKRRALKPTGDTYTCLFEACANSPWPADGLKNTQHLRSLMIEKGIEPNLTNYNAMIKAFGRCGDVASAFQIVDEMISKKIKIRVHTFNHLLHACITDKKTGLQHALVVWRKMIKSREKPNLYSFNLMLKCVKDCNLGTQKDIEELIGILREHISIGPNHFENLPVDSSEQKLLEADNKETLLQTDLKYNEREKLLSQNVLETSKFSIGESNGSSLEKLERNVRLLDCNVNKTVKYERTVPNLLSKVVQMQQVLCLQEVHTVQDKFAVVGGQEDFLKEMEVYSVTPDIKTFTQMLPLLDDNEAENKLLETMKTLKVKADIDFYNLLIKKRCLRSDFDAANAVKEIIETENKTRKAKHHPLKKKVLLKYNILTYGVLALACQTKESAEKLLNEMKENQLKVNIEILGTLLKKGAIQMKFGYVQYIMRQVIEENVQVNKAFMNHLEIFKKRCANTIKENKILSSSTFVKCYNSFLKEYASWLNQVNVEDALNPEHPWEQFKDTYPETVQHTNIKIIEPKRFYKKKRSFVPPYKPKI